MSTCIIIPTYNNASKLRPVLEGVLSQGLPVILINDGSTDDTLSIVEDYRSRLELITYPDNKGKGNALQIGFNKAGELGFDMAITIDSDGQHDPNDIPKLMLVHKEHPEAMLMGSRDLEEAGAPGKSSFGNKFSNFWFRLETGIKLPDTQTGFRLYPVQKIITRRYLTKGFAFEIESIVKLAWSGVEFIPVKISVDYPEDRITHFKPFKDFTRISLLNSWLVTLAIVYYIPKRLIRLATGKTRY